MRTINIHQAKTHLSRLVEEAAKGDAFIIAKAGRPIAQVVPLDSEPKPEKKRLGFSSRRAQVPDDFDRMFEKEIEELFYGKP